MAEIIIFGGNLIWWTSDKTAKFLFRQNFFHHHTGVFFGACIYVNDTKMENGKNL